MVPADTDLLCETCGYTLNGLAEGSNCPECGRPIVESRGLTRHPPEWESQPRRTIGAFLRTSADVIFRPTHFYRSATVRGDVRRARDFAWIHWAISSVFFAVAGIEHLFTLWYGTQTLTPFDRIVLVTSFVGFCVIVFTSLIVTTLLAARLTAWEAAYRGYRLPTPVVRRGLYYHAAHYFPIALLTMATVLTFGVLFARGFVGFGSITTYLYLLCGEVIVFAGYLFHTYWIGMKSMMYANR
jgi:hypothetical protein